MHARVTFGKVAEDKVEEATNTYRESVVPAAREQEGFRGAYLMGDPGKNGKFLSITLWESEEALRAGESNGYYLEQIGKVALLFTEQARVEHYEVSIDEKA